MNDRHPPETPPDDFTRRQWLLRLGEMVVLAGVSGLVPETVMAQLGEGHHTAAGLPPGLYTPSAEHLVHALQSAGKHYSAPTGSEIEYAQLNSHPFHPQFFSPDEFRIVTRFVEIVLGKMHPDALSQTTQWLDLWLDSSAGVLEAAQHLAPLHRVLAVAYFGEPSVRDLETANPQAVAHAGITALHDLSVARYGHPFLALPEPQQVELVASTLTGKPDSPLGKFFETMRNEAIRGYYTSAEGLKELDYQGNSYNPICPGCEAPLNRKT